MTQTFFVKLVILVLVGSVVVFVIDPLDKSTISTPFLLGIILTALSLRQSTQLVAITSILYCIMTVYSLVSGQRYFASLGYFSPHPYFWLFQRAGLFFVVCVLVTYLASFRTESERIRARIQSILAKLPAPVVISDAAGYIVYVNEALCSSFKKNAKDLTNKRYVDLFMTDIQEGKAMRYYIELFAAPGDSVHELEIKPFADEIKTKARLTCLGSGAARVMITLISGGGEGSRDDVLRQPTGVLV